MNSKIKFNKDNKMRKELKIFNALIMLITILNFNACAFHKYDHTEYVPGEYDKDMHGKPYCDDISAMRGIVNE